MTAPGPLAGLRVVELASDCAAFAGRLFADLGAEVVIVEPPDGHRTRHHGPFVDDRPGVDRSLWWWHYNAGKFGVALDLEREGELLRRLLASADIVLDGGAVSDLTRSGCVDEAFREGHPRLIWVAVSPFGRGMPRSEEEAVDLTIMAGAGPVWSCGYDDHALPPVRPGENQGYQTASIWAVMGALVAVLHREVSGRGQGVDVNMHAASNVTTEVASYQWLVRQATVRRQTGRHAAVEPTLPTTVAAADGREVTTGVPPRTAREFVQLLGWLRELQLEELFPEAFFLEMATEHEFLDLSKLGEDPEITAMYGAGREATALIAAHLPAYDFFVGAQSRGLAAGIIYAPDEVLSDPHFVARGFPTEVAHPELGRSVTYPGVAFSGSAAPSAIRRRAPQVGEHNARFLDPLRSVG